MPIVLGDLKLFSVTELADTLGINIQTVRKLVNTGELKGRKMARKWYVTEDSLKEYFDEEEK